MIGKNNSKLFMEKGANKYKRYTLKKISVGVVSVSIGFGLMFGSVEGVSADELTGTNSVVEPNNIDSLQSNEEVSAESNIDKSSETVQSESSEQTAEIGQSLEMKRQEVKTVLGQSNIVGEQYTDLLTRLTNAQTIEELESVLVEIQQTSSLEDSQDLTEQSETEHDAGEKLKNHSEDKDGELDKITPPSTETSLSKEASVENLVEVDQLNVTSDVKYTLNDVRHLLNAADIARIESGELKVQQIIEKLLNNKVELRETEVRHENGVLAAGVEKSSLSSDKQRGKSRSRRSLNNINVDSLFQSFTEQDTVRNVYDRIQQMRDAKLIAETELHFLQIEVLRHLRNGIADNTKDSNNLTPKDVGSKLPTDERILNMNLSKQADVTIPMSRLGGAYNQIINENKKELDYVNELLQNIQSVLLGRFGVNDEGVYFSSDEYYNGATTYGSHKTRKTFHAPVLTSNPNGTITLKMSSENEGGVELKNHYAFSFHINPELNERIKEHQTVEGLYRPENGQQSDENGDKLQNPVGSPIFETNHYPAQNGVFPGNVGYYMSEWSKKEGYDKKKDKFAKIELVFEANDQPIQKAQISSSILSSSFNYRHRSGTFIATQAFDQTAEELKTLLNLMTEYKQLKNKITGTKQKIDEFNQNLGEPTRVISQRDYDTLNATRQELMREIDQIKNDYSTLTEKSMYNNLHQLLKTDISTLKSTVETPLKNLYSVNDLNDNGKKDDQDVSNAEQKVIEAKNKKITLLSRVNALNSKSDITQVEYIGLVSLSNQFKTAIKDAQKAINAIPISDKISSGGESFNVKRNRLTTELPQDDVKLPTVPPIATQTSSDPNEKNSITNPTLVNGAFNDFSKGAKVGAESVNNGVESVPGWTVVNSAQEVIPLINRRKTPTATVSKNEFVNPNNNNAVVLGVSSTEFFTDNMNKGKIDVDKVGGIFQTINVTPGSELVVKFRADSPGYHAGNDQGFDNKRHAVAQAQVEISDADTGTILGTILPPSRGHGEAVGIVSIPEGVNRVKVTLSHKSARTHNIGKGDLASKGWYPGAVVSDVRVSSGSHVTIELTDKSHAYTSTNSDQTPYERTLQVRFNNRGNEKAKATFTMMLPEGVTYRSVSNGTGSYDAQTRILTVTKEGIPGQGMHVTDINLTFDTSAPRTFELETQNVTYATSPDYLPKNSNNGLGRSIQLGNIGSYSVTVAMYTSELQGMVDKYQETKKSFKYYNASNDLKAKYDSVIEEGRQVLENTQSTQQSINDIANRIGTAKDALNGGETDKDALEAAISIANTTINDPFYSRLQDIDSNLKSEYDQAIAEAQKILSNQNTTQEEVKQAANELTVQETKVATKKYKYYIQKYKEAYQNILKTSDDQLYVTEKAHGELSTLWTKLSESEENIRMKMSKVRLEDLKKVQSEWLFANLDFQKLSSVPGKTGVNIPEKIVANSLDELTQEEKEKVEEAIRVANSFPTGTIVEISDDGTATLTFPDSTVNNPSKKIINGDSLVRGLTKEEKLQIQKTKAEAIVRGLNNLLSEEKAVLIADITSATNLAEVAELVEEAIGLDTEKGEETKELDKVKKDAEKTITGLTSLTDGERQTIKNKISKAIRVEEVDGILSEAKDKNEAKANINQFPELTSQERNYFNEQISKAISSEEIDKILQEAEVQAEENYKRDVKADAIQAIDDAVKAKEVIIEKSDLTTEEKATLKGNVRAHANEVKATIGTLDNDVEAAELASEAVTNITLMGMDDETAKATAKDTISQLSTLTPEQQDSWSKAIDNATSDKAIAQILQEAEVQAEENYKRDMKADAIQAIDDAVKAKEVIIEKSDLTTEEKATLKGNVRAHANEVKATIGTLDNDVEAAELASEAVTNITLMGMDDETAKVTAKDTISQLSTLTPEQQDSWSKAIDNATSDKAIAQILQEAEVQAEENYKRDMKADAIQAIDDAVKAKEVIIEKSDLTTEEKATLKGNVRAHANEVKATIGTLDNDVEAAELASEAVTNITLMGMDDETAKVTAKDTISQLSTLTPEQQDSWSKAIDNATSDKAIAQILQEAEVQAEENYKRDVKADAIQAIDDAVKAKEVIIEKSDLTTEEKATLKGNVRAHANEVKATIGTLDNDVEAAELASEAVTNITLMGMDDETAKATAKDTISQLSTLTPEQQDSWSKAIDNATSDKAIAQILQEAEVQAEENYKRDVKADAIQAIDDAVKAKEVIIEKSDLTTEEKATLKGNVRAHANEVKATIGTLDNDVEAAELASEAVTNITLMGMDDEIAKVTAKDTISQLSTLTPEQQDSWSKAIDNATSDKAIAQILQEAEVQAEENYKRDVKADAIQAIDDAVKAKEVIIEKSDLTTEEKATLKGNVRAHANEVKATIGTLDNDVEAAELASEAVTNITLMGMDDETAKATAKDTISQLSTLTPEQQDSWSKAIDNATSDKAIAQILQEAEVQAEENYKRDVKADAIQAIDDAVKAKEVIIEKSDLTTEEKATLKGNVRAHANEVKATIGTLDNDVEAAELASEAVTNITLMGMDDEIAKATAKDTISQLSTLTPEQQDSWSKAIDNATSDKAIAQILQEAEVQAEENYKRDVKADAEIHQKLVETELQSIPNKFLGKYKELTREDLIELGQFDNSVGDFNKLRAHGLGLINEKPAFPAEELARLLQVERDKASAYVGTLSNLDASKVTGFQKAIQQAQTVPAIEAISQTAEALNAKLASSAPESGNGAGTVQPEMPEFDGGTHGLGLINEKPAFPAEELGRLLQVERDKASAYVGTLSNLDASKVTEFRKAIQQAQTVPAIEAISQTAEALNAKLASSAPESGNDEGTVQPEMPEFDGGTHGLGLINEKPTFPAEELGRLLQVERDKASAYVGTLSNLDASKVTEFRKAIQQAQTVPAIEAISQTAEALNAKLASSAPESGNDEGTVQPEMPEFDGGTHGLGLINEKPTFPTEELEQGKVGDEQEQSTEPKAPTQPGQNAPKSEHPVDKPAVTDHLQKVKTQVNGQQSIQESTKQEKSGERLPDTATISWLLGVTGISTLLAGLGLKKKREDDDK
ncbi:SasC/FmtB family protein [Dolosigranulum pigrum]|uniref:SasC/FmtB family protein n=1 Tax=Dolosigranulum pigrum TaxID=29394 RepID=UPI001AD85E4D|nr:SasC/FmtB family protein [Dolosigranulum pigrum]QTJ55031.1 YSIRK-type signal peptide-containing protein [Dolosigranulum pigrum]